MAAAAENLVDARLVALHGADGGSGAALEDAFVFETCTRAVSNLYSFDEASGHFAFEFTENETAYHETEKTQCRCKAGFAIDTAARPAHLSVRLVSTPTQKWGINWAATVLVEVGDGRPRVVYLPGERTYDPAGLTGDAHASERIGASCCRTQTTITCAELAALNLGASAGQLEEIQRATEEVIRRYHGRTTLWKYMYLQLACALDIGRECPSYPDFIQAEVAAGRLDLTDPNRAHTVAFLGSYRAGCPRPPRQYFSKVMAKDGNSIGAPLQRWLEQELTAPAADAAPAVTPAANLVDARLVALHGADGGSGAALEDAFVFETCTRAVSNLYSFDEASGHFAFEFTENETAYHETEKTQCRCKAGFAIDTAARPAHLSVRLVSTPTQKWGINWAATVLVEVGDGRPRVVYLPGERTYDPAGLTGDAHASERIGASCCRTQTTITCAELAALNLGASAGQLEEIQRATEEVIRRYHGRTTLWKYMYLQLAYALDIGRECPSYPDFIQAEVAAGRLDLTDPNRAHTVAFLGSYRAGCPRPPRQYFSKVMAKDGNSIGAPLQRWLEQELTAPAADAAAGAAVAGGSASDVAFLESVALLARGTAADSRKVSVKDSAPSKSVKESVPPRQSKSVKEPLVREAMRRAHQRGSSVLSVLPLHAACVACTPNAIEAAINSGHLDDVDPETNENVLHYMMQLLCPTDEEPWPGVHQWLGYCSATLRLVERGVDTTCENIFRQSPSDLMNVEQLHRRTVRENEPVDARARVCFLAGLVQVFIEGENPVLSALLVAEDVRNLAMRAGWRANNARYAHLAARFTRLALQLVARERAPTTSTEEEEGRILSAHMGPDARTAFALGECAAPST